MAKSWVGERADPSAEADSPNMLGAEPSRDIFSVETFDPVIGREAELGRIAALWLGERGALAVSGGVGVGKSALARAAERALLDKVADPPSFRLQLRASMRRGEARRLLLTLERELRARGLVDPSALETTLEGTGRRILEALRRHAGLVILDGVEALQHPPNIRGGRIKNATLSALVDSLAQPVGGGESGFRSLFLLLGRQPVQETPSSRRLTLGPLPTGAGATLLEAEGLVGGPEELAAAAAALEGSPFALKRMARLIRRETPAGVPPRAGALDRFDQAMLLYDPDGPIDLEARRAAEALAADLRRVERLPPRAAGRGGPEKALLTMAALAPEGLGLRARAGLLEPPAIPGMTEGLLRLRPIARKARLAFAERRLVALGLVRMAEPRDGDEAEDGDRLVAPILVRAAVRARLKAEAPEALGVAERRLFQTVKSGAPSHPSRAAEIAPVAHAIHHGAAGARDGAALSRVFRSQLWDRLLRGERRFAMARLGAFGPITEALSAFFVARWTLPAPGLEPIDQARALSLAGFALRARARLREAAAAQGGAVSSFRGLRRRDDAARALTERAESLLLLGELEKARSAAEAAVQLADALGPASDRRVTALSALAGVEQASGAPVAAARRVRQAAQAQARLTQEGVSDRRRLFSLAGRRAVQILMAEGRLVEAESHARSIEAAALEDGLPLAYGLAQLTLAEIALRRLERDPVRAIPEARECFDRAVKAIETAGRLDILPEALLARGDFLAALARRRDAAGDAAAARRDLERALRLATAAEMRPAIDRAQASLASVS